MKTWRVGTVSMGASLILLGLFLFLSRFFGFDLVHVLTAWWPILLIVLGAEILLYLYFSRQEKPVLKYDLFSIFFVGVLGMFGIMLAILSTTGVIGKVEEVVAREERSFELPAFSYPVNEEIKRVVLRTTGYQMTIEATEAKEVSMFGTYRAQTVKKEKLIKTADDFVSATQKGDTLYVNLKTLPNGVGPFYAQQEVAATILIPNNVKLEVIGNGNQVSLVPRTLESNWSIDNVSSLDIEMNEANNVIIEAVGVNEVGGKDGTWQVTEKGDPNGLEGLERNAVYQSGDGKYRIIIINTHYVSLNTN